MEKKNIKSLVISIICIAVAFLIYYNEGPFIRGLIENPYVADFVCEMMFAIYAVIALFILKRTEVLKFTFKGFGTGLKVGVISIIIPLFALVAYWAQHDPITATPVEITCFVLQMLMIGIAEEVLFRGILQNSIMDVIGYDSVNKIRAGIVISGVIFGLVHITNGFNPEIGFVNALLSVLNVAVLGIVDTTVYYRSKRNLWLLVLLHAINDGVLFMFAGGLSGISGTASMGSGSVGGGLMLPIVVLLVDMWILRRKKIEESMNDR